MVNIYSAHNCKGQETQRTCTDFLFYPITAGFIFYPKIIECFAPYFSLIQNYVMKCTSSMLNPVVTTALLLTSGFHCC